MVGRVLVSTNDDRGGIGEVGGGFESNNDRVLTPWMREFVNGHVGFGIANDLNPSARTFPVKGDMNLPAPRSGKGSAGTVYQSRIGST